MMKMKMIMMKKKKNKIIFYLSSSSSSSLTWRKRMIELQCNLVWNNFTLIIGVNHDPPPSPHHPHHPLTHLIIFMMMPWGFTFKITFKNDQHDDEIWLKTKLSTTLILSLSIYEFILFLLMDLLFSSLLTLPTLNYHSLWFVNDGSYYYYSVGIIINKISILIISCSASSVVVFTLLFISYCS